MSPRAAWRLESLGFSKVYDYVEGKADWAVAGLPREGDKAGFNRAIDVVRRKRKAYAYRFPGTHFDVGVPAGLLKASVYAALHRDDMADDIRQWLLDAT